MGRGIRVHTREMVEIVREQKPFAIGPLLGQLAMKFNISASMIAELLRVHEQTVLRWYMGYSEPSASIHRKMAQLLSLLPMDETGRLPALHRWRKESQVRVCKDNARIPCGGLSFSILSSTVQNRRLALGDASERNILLGPRAAARWAVLHCTR